MAEAQQCVVVIDGANVACQKDGRVTISKLAAAVEFFRSCAPAAGNFPIKCVAFAPNFWLHSKGTTREKDALGAADMALLDALVQKDHVVLTPSHAHDDFYVIDYAVKHHGFIVTNDMFRDHVANKRVFHGKRLTTTWVRSHCIDFTFVGNEFMPNPRAMERVANYDPATAVSASVASSSISAVSGTATTGSSSLRTLSGASDVETNEEEEDEMVVDHAGSRKKKNIDLSEVTYYKVPRELLPMLHGEDGDTMDKFQEYTGTYIVLPSSHVATAQSSSASSQPDVLTLSIYGPEENRQQAIGHLDAFLLEMQQKAQLAFLQQQQQQQQLSMQYSSGQAYQPNSYYHAAPAGGSSFTATQDDQMMDVDPY